MLENKKVPTSGEIPKSALSMWEKKGKHWGLLVIIVIDDFYFIEYKDFINDIIGADYSLLGGINRYSVMLDSSGL